jgi:ubiquitin C-terminal hydrolase
MDGYDPSYTPPEFGLNNTGVICYLNSFLQVLASCTALTKAVLQNEEYLSRTATGAAVFSFVRGYHQNLTPNIEFRSAQVLTALVTDLRARRPNVKFGGGQESASEALVLILDMMEPATAAAAVAAGPVHSIESPITRLFLHRFRCDTYCCVCRKSVSKEIDHAVNFNLFHIDQLKVQPNSPKTFSQAICRQISATEDYKCAACAPSAAAPNPAAYRVYNLTMVPEIIVCVFNLYVGFGGVRQARYIPDRLEFPAVENGRVLRFRLVGQVEHAGSLSGGHYWARALRAHDQVFLLNDRSVTPASFASTPNTYMVFYHFDAECAETAQGGADTAQGGAETA